MINKERYNFDHRFSTIAEKVLSFNGMIPSDLPDQTAAPAKPHDFESYLMQNDSDYKLLKQGNFYTGPAQPTASSNIFSPPISQPSVTQPMHSPAIQPYYQSPIYPSIQSNQQVSSYYSPQIPQVPQSYPMIQSNNGNWQGGTVKQQTPAKKTYQSPRIDGESNLFSLVQWNDQKPSSLPLAAFTKDRTLDSFESKEQKRAETPFKVYGEMILNEQRDMMAAMKQQQDYFQYQILARLEAEEAKRQAKKQEKELSKAIEPMLQSQERMMEAIVKKIQARDQPQQNLPPPPKSEESTNRLIESMMLMASQNRQRASDQQYFEMLQQQELEKRKEQQDNQLIGLMMQNMNGGGGLFQPAGTSMDQNRAYPIQAPPPPMKNQSITPNLRDMQKMLFANQKSKSDAVIQGLLKDIHR